MALETPSPLDQKILEHFPGLVVRKDLTTELKQNAVVPTYVLEYLLGQHCATDDQAQLVKSTLNECGTHKVIDKLTVELNEKGGFYEGCYEGWQIIFHSSPHPAEIYLLRPSATSVRGLALMPSMPLGS